MKFLLEVQTIEPAWHWSGMYKLLFYKYEQYYFICNISVNCLAMLHKVFKPYCNKCTQDSR